MKSHGNRDTKHVGILRYDEAKSMLQLELM